MPKAATKPPVLPGMDKNRPVHVLRHRHLKATVWKNDTEKGPMYNVTVVRSFKDPKTDQWKDSHSFGYDDLMNVSALMYEAHAFISALRAKEAMERKSAE